ncbi:AraC family transcriptional regulator [Lactobacillus delbrueckii]|uniref:AraC family transcriptional regulator n=1 Tax=Lactobacillus delbrueckii TaxID=1584 RepID=UPI0022E5A1AD|nr:AraC family transcriptional regulator [Lactobacillus delbrueckii]
MTGEYRQLNKQNIDSNILFYGQENCAPGYFYRGNNVRSNYVIHYILSGRGTFAPAGQAPVSLQAGDLFILPKGVACFYQADFEDPWSYFWVGMSGMQIGKILQNSKLSDKFYLHQVQDSGFYKSLRQLFHALHMRESLASNMLTESLLYQTFYQLLVDYPTGKRQQSGLADDYFIVAMTFLEDNFEDPACSVSELCQQLGLSRSYVYNLFKNKTDLSPQQFLTKLRMEQAKELLSNSDLNVQAISHFVGYNDSFTFSKAFKRYQGLSPKSWRQIKNAGN